ncbi:hypothetical protein [Pedobacter nototheniae]|uniref:hypothetical protein n=1 Tax=Pedobacter nototheniae TaxID=2488994 RepID=UPI001040C410|nr:hypothetical protein [Pedobacter nototheniae]
MENVVKVFKYRIINEIKSLSFIEDILKIEPKIQMCGELEIEPYIEFSVNFQSDYWYIKYLLLKDQLVNLNDEFKYFYNEPDLNIIWASFTDGKTFLLEFKDGQPFISFSKDKLLIKKYFEQFILNEF